MECGKQIGLGNTAEVYEWGDSQVLKLFYEGYSEEAIQQEYMSAEAIKNMPFVKPKVYKKLTYQGRKRIVYEKMSGESLLAWLMRTGDIETGAAYMANLHKTIMVNEVSGVSNYKDFLRYHINNSVKVISRVKEDALSKVAALPEGTALCHGDFHPGNILLGNGEPVAIDFMNVCCGYPLYDVARTVYLVEYTPVPMEIENKADMALFRTKLTNQYLQEMNVSRDELVDYLDVITIARTGECPNEF